VPEVDPASDEHMHYIYNIYLNPNLPVGSPYRLVPDFAKVQIPL
jgi:hypothetical protein